MSEMHTCPKCVLELHKKKPIDQSIFFNIFGASTSNQGRMLIIFVRSN